MGRVRNASRENKGTWTSRCRVTGKPRSSLSWSKRDKRAWRAQIDKILALYARGMTTRDIQAQLQEMYGVEVSPTLISNVTEAVMDEVRQWQTRPLEAVYPIVSVD
ncbi:MAG TPA: transposase [Ktedonobacteraceae bacterium]|nr:transposase [Ktedonobacteraceae bacterium]